MESKKILLQIMDLKKYFPIPKTSLLQKKPLFVQANDSVSLCIYEGETLGLVGESGCGKSTLGRVLLKLYAQTSGTILYHGRSRREFAPRYVKKRILHLARAAQKQTHLDKEDLDNLRIFGALLQATDLDAIANAFLAEYHAAAALFLSQQEKLPLLLKKQALQTRNTGAATAQTELRTLDDKLKKIDAVILVQTTHLESCSARLDQLRTHYSGNEAFQAAEALRDDSIDLSQLTPGEMRFLRKDLQMIFQDPYSSLNPRMSAGQMIGDALVAHNLYQKNSAELRECVSQAMQECGLAPYMLHRYPHQFSGGERQRIGIARALALRPKFVVCDEAVSALDVSIQAQIINLLQDLKQQKNFTCLFISHDLSVVKHISDRIGVMYLGRLVELAATEALFTAPRHPYTQALLAAIPTIDDRKNQAAVLLEGDIPSPIDPPCGCKFHTRCRFATAVCRNLPPRWEEISPGHLVACHNKEHLVISKEAVN